MQKVCFDAKCAAEWAKSERERDNRKKATEYRRKNKTHSQLTSEAQAAINAFVRVRDYGKPCISCNKPMDWNTYGGKVDCGHYRSRGSAGHLRFNLFNMAAQCHACNRYLSGAVVDYRINLIGRIGIERVERIEQDNKPRSFDREYLERVKRIFRKKERLYKRLFRN